MRYVYILFVLLVLVCCKNENQDVDYSVEEEDVESVVKVLNFADDSLAVDALGDEVGILVNATVDFLFDFSQDWVTEGENSDSNSLLDQRYLYVQIAENRDEKERYAEVIIYNESHNLSDTLFVIQMGAEERLFDGDYRQLQQASLGKANLVIMGDGFTSDYLLESRYGEIMEQATEYFFSIEPFTSYRDYFNVYMVVAESEDEGIGEVGALGSSTIKNKFGTSFGQGTAITCDDDLVFEYARKIPTLSVDMPITVIVVLNSTKYAGTTYLYSNGNSIALCPMSMEESPNDFEGLIHHEAGGHGFGFLCDEYIYYPQTIPAAQVQDIKDWQKLGFQMNLDFTNDATSVLWKDFIGIEKYESMVGIYEGGYEYQYGVWRAEENSCMNNNIPYFNVQSRWSIVRRIMELSDLDFNLSDFIENDNPIYPVEDVSTRGCTNFIPLASPIMIQVE